MSASSQVVPSGFTGGNLTVAAIALAAASFMQVLDSTIANVSIPTIAGNLGASVDQGTWVITAFAVANGISVPLTGWLMQRYGVVRTFVGSVLLFTMFSLLCGLAWNMPSLVFFRVLQGGVSGPMMPGSQALLLMVFGRERQATAFALSAMTTLVAPICGPILGGWISDNFSWPWIFLINVPVGLLCAAACWSFLNGIETPTRRVPVDTVGFGLLVVWVGALQIMLDTGKNADWFSSPAIVVEALVAVVAFISWLIWELNDAHPIVDLSLFRSSNFAFGTLAFCLGYATFFGNTLLLPLLLQTQLGYTASWAGLVAAPSGVVAVIVTPFVARIIARVDARWTASMSFVAFTLSYFMRSWYAPDADFTELVIPLLVQGVSMSSFFMSMSTIYLNGVAAHQIPTASSLNGFARSSAAAFSASLVTTMWERGAALHQTRILESTGAVGNPIWTQAMQGLQQQGASVAQSAAVMAQQVAHQAFFLAALDIFRISAFITLALIPIVWLTKPAIGGGSHAPAAD